MPEIATCLWYDKQAQAAAEFYTSLLPNSSVDEVMRTPIDYPGGETGEVITVAFTLNGAKFMALNGGGPVEYGLAASVMVACEDQAEIDRLWAALIGGGGKEIQCGWLNDRWGVPWQIFPRRFTELMTTCDEPGRKRVMEAMVEMVKMDLAALESAAAG